MYVEISAPSKCFTTHVTLVQFITSSVNAFVFLKCAAVPKYFAAYVTDVLFITGVNAFVYYEVALLCKGFITHVIFVLFITIMDTFVSLTCAGLESRKALPHTSQVQGLSPI